MRFRILVQLVTHEIHQICKNWLGQTNTVFVLLSALILCVFQSKIFLASHLQLEGNIFVHP